MKKYFPYIFMTLVLVIGLFVNNVSINKSVGEKLDNISKPASEGTFGINSKDGFTTTDTVSAEQLTSTDDGSITDDLTVGDTLSYGSVVHDCIEGSFADATTTIVSVVNPFSATAFISLGDFMLYGGENGTTTVDITCGTSSIASLTSDPSDSLIDDLTVATSTLGTATSTFQSYNSNGTVALGKSGFLDPGTNSQDVVEWKSGEYITCYADETDGSGGLTSGTNIFTGNYRICSYN